MIAYQVTEIDLRVVASSLGLTLINVQNPPSGHRGPVRFRLGLLPDRRYGRLSSTGSGRRVAAVCWHGHRDFFLALFARAPSARVQTVSTRTFPRGQRFYTAGTFEQMYRGTDRRVGSVAHPMRYSEACRCHQHPVRNRPRVVPPAPQPRLFF